MKQPWGEWHLSVGDLGLVTNWVQSDFLVKSRAPTTLLLSSVTFEFNSPAGRGPLCVLCTPLSNHLLALLCSRACRALDPACYRIYNKEACLPASRQATVCFRSLMGRWGAGVISV